MSGRATRRRGGRTALALALVAALSITGCIGDDPVEPEREPLGSPPDPGPVPDDHGLSDSLVAETLASTVAVSGVACGRHGNGSGFAIASDLVVTGAHVIMGLDPIEVRTFDGRELTGSAVAFDPEADLAIIEVDGADLAPLPLALEVADDTVGMLVGWHDGAEPDPKPFRIDRPVAVRIEAVGTTERVERPSWLLAADVERGDSGGALVDGAGEVVGVAYASSRQGPGVGYAVRASEVDALVARGFDPNLTVPGCCATPTVSSVVEVCDP